MHTYEDAAELAIICVRNACSASNRAMATELWRMAKEYQAEAASMMALITALSGRWAQGNTEQARNTTKKANAREMNMSSPINLYEMVHTFTIMLEDLRR